MSTDHEGSAPRARRVRSRRQFLATTAGLALGAVAGCSGVTEQSFEATPVVLPSDDREELWLGETVRDAPTINREGPGGTELTITNHAAVYTREAGLGGE